MNQDYYNYNCWFCKEPLSQTDKMHSGNRYIYQCKSCPMTTEHLFYNDDKSLTLRTYIQFKNQSYILYLYPDYKPAVLLSQIIGNSSKAIIKLPEMKGFTSHNLQSK